MADIKETKRGTTPMLKVNFNGLAEDKAVVRAEFIFKQKALRSRLSVRLAL